VTSYRLLKGSQHISTKSNRFYLSLALLPLALVGAATLMASLAARSYAQKSAQVAKQPQPAPQALWVVSNEYTASISVFQPAQLNKSGTVGSYGIRNRIDAVGALAFDRSHDLWAGLYGASSAGYSVELTRTGLRRMVASGCDGSNHNVSRFTLGPRQHED
jgi:hypothetical protein